MRMFVLLFALALPAVPGFGQDSPAAAPDHATLARRAYEQHILPGFERFAGDADALANTALGHCAPDDPDLRAAYQAAFDAWMRVQHLRFGPTEVEDRGYALAFWPDQKGRTPAGLNALLARQDPAVVTPEGIAEQSIAVRGFFALDYLLYDPAATGAATPYGCKLISAIAGDIARIADALAADWSGSYGAAFTSAGAAGNTAYRTPSETTAALFTSLLTGLEANKDRRLGRPMGTFAAPTPARAEARRSGRAQRNLILSLEALSELAAILADSVSPDAAAHVGATTDRAVTLARKLDDPVFAGAANPSGRLHLEQDQQAIAAVSTALLQYVGPSLGVAQGFNALDGDGG